MFNHYKVLVRHLQERLPKGLLCCEVTTRSTKVSYLMYLGNSNGVLLVLILSCCEDESMLLA